MVRRSIESVETMPLCLDIRAICQCKPEASQYSHRPILQKCQWMKCTRTELSARQRLVTFRREFSAVPADSISLRRVSSAAVTAFRISFRSLPMRGRSSFGKLRMFSLSCEITPVLPRNFTRMIFKCDFAGNLLDLFKRRFLQSLKLVVHRRIDRNRPHGSRAVDSSTSGRGLRRRFFDPMPRLPCPKLP